MIAGLVIAGFIAAPDQLLEDVAHLAIGNKIRMQVDLRELGYDQIQAVGFVQFADLFLKTEMIDDVASTAGEALDILCQIGGNVVRIALQLLE